MRNMFLKVNRGLKAQLLSMVLSNGEPCVTLDTGELFIGIENGIRRIGEIEAIVETKDKLPEHGINNKLYIIKHDETVQESGTIYIYTDNAYELIASGTNFVNKADLNGNLNEDFAVKNLNIAADILPTQNGTQSIGTPDKRFKSIYANDLYLSTNTLYLGDTPILGTENTAVNMHAKEHQDLDVSTKGQGKTNISSEDSVNIKAPQINLDGPWTIQNLILDNTTNAANIEIKRANNQSYYITFSETDEKLKMGLQNSLKNIATEDFVQQNQYIHPITHPASMITGLSKVAITGDYNDLLNRPVINGCMITTNTSGITNGNNYGSAKSIGAYDNTGRFSFALGYANAASGDYSFSTGNNNQATGTCSTVSGYGNIALGSYSYVQNNNNIASGDESSASGYGTKATGRYSTSFGNMTTASGEDAITEGYNTKAKGSYTHAFGNSTIANGTGSIAEGYNTVATGDYSHIMGQNGTITDVRAWALANGNSSWVPGLACKILSTGQVIANSTFSSSGADYAEMFEWLDDNINKEDRVGYFVTTVGDKIRKATSKDDYILGIVSATPSILGDSEALNWKGRYLKDEWGRLQYEDVLVEDVKDEDGNIIIPAHTETQLKINPNWDANLQYVDRLSRPEWSAIGITGKLLVRDDGTCQEDSYCKSNDEGVATKSDCGYRVLKRISTNQILIFIK